MQASTRGTTSRWIGSMPSTIIASSSSRILRAPRSAAIADPPAPAISSEVAMGPASRTTARTAAEPVNDWAPNCLIRPPTSSAMTAPKGMATSAVGMIVTEAMNQACWMTSGVWRDAGTARGRRRGRRRRACRRSRSARGPGWQSWKPSRCVPSRLAGPGSHRHLLLEGARGRLHAVLTAPATRLSLAAAGDAVGGLELERDRRQRRQVLPLLGLELVGVLLLGHADGADPLGVEELPDHRLLGGEQHLARAEHGEVAVVEQTDVVGHGPRSVDVVGDDQEGRVDLGVEVDDELVEERRTDRVETGVGLVEEDDLGVEHQRACKARALAHAAGDLTGQLVLGAEQADEVHLLHDDVADLRLGLPGV